MHRLQAIAIEDSCLAEPNQGATLDQKFSHQQVKGAAVCVAWVVEDVQVVDLGELEHLEGLLERFDLVVANVQVLQLGQLCQLILENLDFVSAQVQALQNGQAALPAVEGGDEVVGEVQLFQLGHALEVAQVLQLVIERGNNAQVRVSGPFRADLLQFIAADVQVVQLGALEGWPLCELVIGDVEPFEVGEGVLLSEDCEVLDLVIRQVQPCQSGQRVQRADIDQAVIGKIDNCNIFDLFRSLRELLELLAGALEVAELEAFLVARVVQVGHETADDTWFQNKLRWGCCLCHL